MQTISESQTSPEVPINENFETLAAAAVYGKRHPATSGLTWGYEGGRWGGFAVTQGTLALASSTTNYIVVNRTTGAISVSSSATNWNASDAYARVYKVTTSASAVTAVEDHRAGPNGVLSGGISVQRLADLLDVNYSGSPSPAEGDALVYRSGEWVQEPKGKGTPIEIQLSVSDLANNLASGTNKAYVRAPCAFTILELRTSLLTASSSGLVTVDVNRNGATILSTKLSIDATEKTSLTAATPYVLTNDDVANDDEITVDIDAAGAGAKGLILLIRGERV